MGGDDETDGDDAADDDVEVLTPREQAQDGDAFEDGDLDELMVDDIDNDLDAMVMDEELVQTAGGMAVQVVPEVEEDEDAELMATLGGHDELDEIGNDDNL